MQGLRLTMPSERLVSLDAFRGLTMALMVLVNAAPGAIWSQLRHAPWNGWTIADTIFPSFLWIAGVSLALSLEKRIETGQPRARLLLQVFRRALILFCLGIAVYVAPYFDLSTQRIMGVLQRIAICYLLCGAVYLFSGLRGQIIWTAALLVGYWLLMMFAPVPHFGAGDLTIAGNFEHYVDGLVLGRHNYRYTQTWDPEGVVSTLPAISSMMFGVLAARLLRTRATLARKAVWLMLAGIALLAAGSVCNVWLPINKHIWTSSFAVFMAGLAFVAFGFMLWLVDCRGYRTVVEPFVILGRNAIAVYLASEWFAEFIDAIPVSGHPAESLPSWVYRSLFLRFAPDPIAALLYATAFLFLIYLFAVALYRKNWFLKV
jgi:predicted acyltransferase